MSEPDASRQEPARPLGRSDTDERVAAGGIPLRVAVVGATGAVGEEMRRLLETRAFPVEGDPVFVASERSAGRRLPFGGRDIEVVTLDPDIFDDVDVALFSAGSGISREWAPIAAERGTTVVDNSSAFRQHPEVPLVVTEVNPHHLEQRPRGIIANPNCTTMVLLVAVKPLHDRFGLTDMVATSYQSAGGAGQGGISELLEQARKLLDDPDGLRRAGTESASSVSPEQFSKAVAFNVLAHCGSFTAERYTDEEWKLVNESRKILDLPDLRVSPTCVRVPVVVGHAIAARLTFETKPDLDAAWDALRAAPGLVLEDGTGLDGEPLAYPTPLESAGRDEVFVGRVRHDLADPRALNIWVVGDNLLKGAALNTVQIAELLAPRLRV
jgi:aspartate-semialdehyde dehydrogenase